MKGCMLVLVHFCVAIIIIVIIIIIIIIFTIGNYNPDG